MALELLGVHNDTVRAVWVTLLLRTSSHWRTHTHTHVIALNTQNREKDNLEWH